MRPIALVGKALAIPIGGLGVVDDQIALVNPRRTGVLIDEIRLGTVRNVATGAPVAPTDAQVRILLGRNPITSGFVPMHSIGRVINESVLVNNTLYNPSANAALLQTIWRLPKPMFVPSTEQLTVTFKNQPQLDGVTGNIIDAHISLVGRELDDGDVAPKEVSLPWVSVWQPQVAINAASVNTSRETDLSNPFSVPLVLQRITGRMLYANAEALSNNPQSSVPVGQGALVAGNDAWSGARYLTVRAMGPRGEIICRDPVPFGHFFSLTDRSMPVRGATMPPGSFYQFILEAAANPLAVTNANFPVTITLQGYRSVTLREVASS